LDRLGDKVADVSCFESADLTTKNALSPPNGPTTPANNSLPGLPPFAFTPQTDRNVISPDPPDRTPITAVVPGIQVQGRFADDPTGQARFLLRLPNDWNGRLVVAGASGTRSEFNGDFAWSDFVLQKGYAYASQNKGVLNLRLSTAADPLACRLNPASPVFVHFFDNDPEKPFTQWTKFIVRTARLARRAAKAQYHRHPRRIYVVGTSNGGFQVRRAIEEAPHLFDGGVDWEGTFVDPQGPNLLIDLPPAIKNFPAYVASGFDPNSEAAQNIRAAGYPPDLVSGLLSFWGLHSNAFWEVTQCQWQKRLDPTYDTYGAGPGNYDYAARVGVSDVEEEVAKIATTGKIKKPLVTVAGTMDALLPIQRHARAYQAKVMAPRRGDDDDDDDDEEEEEEDDRRKAQYRLYEVQNGNHIENFRNLFPQLEFIQPHAQRAFDLLVDHVENRAPLPPDQCIPRGGTISAAPAQPGNCAALFVP
ncbi:MAG: 3-hydroxybutyrate oligomer hydrolase family protein, partial [Candidatus Methylomirabilales bacterium]